MKTPITYYGGKQTMLRHILPLMPQHTNYTEAFCGGAAVYFAKEPASGFEVINDQLQCLVTFYQEVVANFDRLKERIDLTPHSRDVHTHARHILAFPCFFTRLDIAWAVWTLSRISFASKLDGTFGYDRSGRTLKKLCNAKVAFDASIRERLDRTTIENRDALEVIRLYDTPETFHFIDPPYVGSDCGHYKGSFTEQHLTQLLDLLTQIKGKFMLTMFPNDNIERYATEHGWTIHPIERTISASKTTRRKQEEWIICNYQAEEG